MGVWRGAGHRLTPRRAGAEPAPIRRRRHAAAAGRGARRGPARGGAAVRTRLWGGSAEPVTARARRWSMLLATPRPPTLKVAESCSKVRRRGRPRPAGPALAAAIDAPRVPWLLQEVWRGSGPNSKRLTIARTKSKSQNPLQNADLRIPEAQLLEGR